MWSNIGVYIVQSKKSWIRKVSRWSEQVSTLQWFYKKYMFYRIWKFTNMSCPFDLHVFIRVTTCYVIVNLVCARACNLNLDMYLTWTWFVIVLKSWLILNLNCESTWNVFETIFVACSCFNQFWLNILLFTRFTQK